jgi:methylmalonyl-CoA mutase cobalamin-binding subunit
VHVAGILNFFRLAESQGYRTIFLGAAVPVDKLVGAARETDASIIAVGYRLGRRAARGLFDQLAEALTGAGLEDRRVIFGGTPGVAEVAEATGLFDAVFSGREDLDEIIAYLKGEKAGRRAELHAGTLLERMAQKAPYPVIRHHFGLPVLDDTVRGIELIASEGVLDVISIGPDQNAQEHFFTPGDMDPAQDGAGGVPVRSAADFRRLYLASRRGNRPLLRCYSGTRDLIKMAEVLHVELKNAWAAVPLFWYNEMDGRSNRALLEAIAENQLAMRWHAERGIAVEVNESHHWSLREAHDTIAVATAFLAAYNARAAGVKHYIAQLMLNTPPGTLATMDLGKMLAKLDLIESLAGPDFKVYRQVRAGLASFPPDLDVAKGHLAAATQTGLHLRPHIVHVVAYCEAVHIAQPEDVVASCRIARGVIRQGLDGMPDAGLDPQVQARRRELVAEARLLLEHLRTLAVPGADDPWIDPETLTRAVVTGVLDAPHLVSNPVARGRLRTQMIAGACRAIDVASGRPLAEEERLAGLSHT